MAAMRLPPPPASPTIAVAEVTATTTTAPLAATAAWPSCRRRRPRAGHCWRLRPRRQLWQPTAPPRWQTPWQARPREWRWRRWRWRWPRRWRRWWRGRPGARRPHRAARRPPPPAISSARAAAAGACEDGGTPPSSPMPTTTGHPLPPPPPAVVSTDDRTVGGGGRRRHDLRRHDLRLTSRCHVWSSMKCVAALAVAAAAAALAMVVGAAVAAGGGEGRYAPSPPPASPICGAPPPAGTPIRPRQTPSVGRRPRRQGETSPPGEAPPTRSRTGGLPPLRVPAWEGDASPVGVPAAGVTAAAPTSAAPPPHPLGRASGPPPGRRGCSPPPETRGTSRRCIRLSREVAAVTGGDACPPPSSSPRWWQWQRLRPQQRRRKRRRRQRACGLSQHPPAERRPQRLRPFRGSRQAAIGRLCWLLPAAVGRATPHGQLPRHTCRRLRECLRRRRCGRFCCAVFAASHPSKSPFLTPFRQPATEASITRAAHGRCGSRYGRPPPPSSAAAAWSAAIAWR